MNVLERLTMSDYQPAQRTVAGSIIPTIRCFLITLLLTLSIALPVAASETPKRDGAFTPLQRFGHSSVYLHSI